MTGPDSTQEGDGRADTPLPRESARDIDANDSRSRATVPGSGSLHVARRCWPLQATGYGRSTNRWVLSLLTALGLKSSGKYSFFAQSGSRFP